MSIRLTILFPLIFSTVYLGVSTVSDIMDLEDIPYFAYIPPSLIIIVPLMLLIISKTSSKKSKQPKNPANTLLLTILTPCFVAPFAVMYIWTIAPAPLGIGLGGYQFFLHWLTKYPNFAGINIEVFIGICCVISSSFLPVFFTLCIVSNPTKRGLALIIVIAQLVVYIPVLIRLDRWLISVAFSFYSKGGYWLFLTVSMGACFRAIATSIMILVLCWHYLINHQVEDDIQSTDTVSI